MKSMLISLLIIAILLVLYLKPFLQPDARPDASAPSDKFMTSCLSVSATQPRAGEYCACLWKKGVRKVQDTLIKPAAKSAAKACAQTR